MNGKNIIKNRIIAILSVLAVLIFAAAVASGVLFLYTDTEAESSDYSIIVDDQITVYEGETFTVVPYLVNKEGTVVDSRFDYTASDDAISVSADGVISVNSVPENEVYVTIDERNTSVSTKIKVNVVGKLANVLGITFSDSAGNVILISGSQELAIGETYVINVVTEPQNVEIENYCQLQTLSTSGEQKEVFEFSYSGSNVEMKVTGLGSGELDINIADDEGQSLYKTTINFSISTGDSNLTGDILNSASATLLTQEELEAIETIELGENVSDLSGLQYLTSLKTVVFTSSGKVIEPSNISPDYCYRVQTSAFSKYADSDAWTDYLGCILPYANDVTEVYVVFHNDKTESGKESLSYKKIDSVTSFDTLTYEGYKNYGWLDKNGNEVTVADIGSLVELNGVHLYAGWEPISYTVVYHIRDYNKTYSYTWEYDQSDKLKTAADLLSTVSRTGYKFAGWSTNSESSVYSTHIDYDKDTVVSNLTSTDGAKIHLYDIWEPIEYTIIFNTVDGMDAIEDLTVKYNTAYTLPAPSVLGYVFTNWKTSSGKTLDSGVNDPNDDSSLNLASKDGAEVILTPVFTEIEYTITFDFGGGTLKENSSITESSVTLKYTESYVLPELEKNGYTVYSWLCSENGKIYGSTETISKVFTFACDATFTAIWTSAIYTIYYDCDGGEIDGESSVTSSRYWDDGISLSTPARTGYTFSYWKNTESGEVYKPSDAIWSENLISSAEDNGAKIYLTAVWEINYYTLTITQGTGTSLTVKVDGVTKTNGSKYSVAYNSAITVTYSAATGYNSATCTYTGGTMPAYDLTIESGATANTHKITITTTDATITVKNSSGTKLSSGTSVAYGTELTVSVSYSYDNNKTCYCSYNGTKYNSGTTSYTLTMPDYDVTFYASSTSSCLAKGTMIMLADGGSVAVENIQLNDVILSYDHTTGQFVENRVLFVFYDYGYAASIELYFSDNTTLEFLNNGHGLYDVTLSEYVLIDAANVQNYVGHQFLQASYVNGAFVAQTVELVDYNVSYKEVERYDLVTEETLNHIANGLLACSDTLVGVCNTFEFNADGTYNLEQMQADIATYGLYTYEEWSEYLSYEDFVSFNGAYFKITVGKGLITIDEILSLLDDLANNRQ